MNLNALDSHVMIAHSTQWLTHAAVRAPIERHALGQAMLAEVHKAHSRLSQQAEKRRQHRGAVATLTERIADTDLRHDRNAKALYAALTALIESEEDPAIRDGYQRIQALLFPEGLAIVSRTFSYQAGAVETLKRRVTPALRDQLAKLPLGPKTFDSLFEAWVEAGLALGDLVAERERLLHRAQPSDEDGDEDSESPPNRIDMRGARAQWISVAHAFLNAMNFIALSEDERNAVLRPLKTDIASAVRSRGRTDDSVSELPDGGDGAEPPAGGDGGGDGDGVSGVPSGGDNAEAPAVGDGAEAVSVSSDGAEALAVGDGGPATLTA